MDGTARRNYSPTSDAFSEAKNDAAKKRSAIIKQLSMYEWFRTVTYDATYNINIMLI